jgi:hypothetical protein
MTYQGGPVVHAAKVYLIGWLPTGTHFDSDPNYSDTKVWTLFQTFFKGIGGTSYYNVATQYPDTTGPPLNQVTLAGSYIYTTAFPNGNQVSDTDIQNAIIDVKRINGWSACADCIFFVDLPYNITAVKGGSDFCGYHEDVTGIVLYAVQSPGNCPNFWGNVPHPNSAYVDLVTDTTAHELLETVTDPLLNTGKPAWYETNVMGEISDKCVFRFGAQNSDGSNISLGNPATPFVIQEQWSNNTFNGTAYSGCVMSYAGITTTVVNSSANPSTQGQPVTFTATVGCPGNTPTGTVTFFDSSTNLGSAPLGGSPPAAAFSTSTLIPGGHGITVDYNGSGLCAVSTSPVLLQEVDAPGVSVALASSSNPSIFGQSVTFTATVTCTGNTPTGTVTFVVDGTRGAPVALNNGVGSFSTAGLSAGAHSIFAEYSGGGPCGPGGSPLLEQAVDTTGVTVTLVSSANPSTAGLPVTLAATVACPVQPTGTVGFLNGGMLIGTQGLNGSAAALTVTLPAGTHTITAVYNGDANCGAGASAPLNQQVGAAVPSISTGGFSLVSSQNPSNPGQAVTFSAAIPCPGFTPAGIVTFTIDGSAGMPLALSGGTATFTISTLTTGSHSVSAAYSGDANCGPSMSSTLTQAVNPDTTQVPVGFGYCYPAANAPPPGAPCTPYTGSGAALPPGPIGAAQLCTRIWSTLAEQQSCIAQTLGNVGGFICVIGCSTVANPSSGSAGGSPARLPGAYCTMSEGAKQWVPQGAAAPAGCT